MKKLLLLSVLLITNGLNAQIGIGTNTPSANAVLDVNSTNKGLMLPRLDNTSLVSSPTAGLMIYDKSTSAPALHNGMQWNSIMMMPSVDMTDSLSYSFLTTGGYPNLTLRSLPMLAFNTTGESAYTPGSPSPPPNMSPISFTKLTDENTIGLLNLFYRQPVAPNIVIEVKVYKKGVNIPYFTYKLSKIIVVRVSFEASTNGSGNKESYLIYPQIYGWQNTQIIDGRSTRLSIAWDSATRSIVPY